MQYLMMMMMMMAERRRKEWEEGGREGVWREEQVGDEDRERRGNGNEGLGITEQADKELAIRKVSIGIIDE